MSKANPTLIGELGFFAEVLLLIEALGSFPLSGEGFEKAKDFLKDKGAVMSELVADIEAAIADNDFKLLLEKYHYSHSSDAMRKVLYELT